MSTAPEILWDTWGVPHIFAADEIEAAYATGWAQMRSHGDLILRLYAQSRGRGAEYFGEAWLEQDRKVHTLGIPAHSERWMCSLSPRARAISEAFAAGVNAFATAHGETLSEEARRVLPVSAQDVTAQGLRTIFFTFVYRELALEPIFKQWLNTPGSNAWALGPKHTASGSAILLGNPHLPWSDLYLFYELHVHTPDYQIYGASLVGLPIISLGFNPYLGWTHTVNTYNGTTLYELTVEEGGYRLDGEVLPFETEEYILKVREQDGSLREEKHTVRRARHGPVILEKEGRAIAARIAGLDRYGIIDTWVDMAKATCFAEFEATLRRMQMPMFNVIYADRAGNIMELFSGQVPVRSEGDAYFWAGIVPGDKSALLWSVYHPYEDLPRVVNPESGWLSNSNEPPWYMTIPYPLKPEDYPAYLSPPKPLAPTVFRPQISKRMLMENPGLTMDRIIRLKFSTRSELADRLLDELIAAARADERPLAQQAADALTAWDHHYEPESRGAVLFHRWYEPYWMEAIFKGEAIFAEEWDNNADPFSLPRGLANPQEAVSRLVKAAEQLQEKGIPLDAPWGEVVRMRVGEYDLPARGGPGTDTFRMLNLLPNFTDQGKLQVYHGDTFIFVVEFSDPPRALVLNTYGNATQPGSAHVGDQLPLYARNELRPAWLSREEIEAHLELREALPGR